MTDKIDKIESTVGDCDAERMSTDNQDEIAESRRAFLIGLGKWSRAVIAGAIVGGGLAAVERPAQAGWLNRRGCCRGGGWINGGGGSWANRRGGWGAGWINRR